MVVGSNEYMIRYSNMVDGDNGISETCDYNNECDNNDDQDANYCNVDDYSGLYVATLLQLLRY